MALQVNEYFGGNVKSIGFENGEGRATAGVMAIGEYQFGTTEIERVKVVSGLLNIRLPGETDFQAYPAGTEFGVAANVKFDVQVETPTAYVCFYGG